MRLQIKRFGVSAGRPIVFLRDEDANREDINVGDRIQVARNGRTIQARVDIVADFIKRGEVALTDDILAYLSIQQGEYVDVTLMPSPRSAVYIAKKTNGRQLAKEEIKAIVDDVVSNALTEAEISEFIVGVYRNGMTDQETIHLTEAMYTTGAVIRWHSKVVADKHCIGGIAGNRTTPIVVSICAAAGIVMPKTSSRAITSAAGTAYVVETLTRVTFSARELKTIVKETGACLAWGGSLGLAPADDKLIRIERIPRLDPDAQLIASILSKKIAAGSTHVVIDIPYGNGAKVTKQRGIILREKFLRVGRHFGLIMRVLLTDGSQPIGNGIGPVLEMIDVLKVLHRREPPTDLEDKSLYLAGEILELTNTQKKGRGKELAKAILDSGKAAKKFEDIISAQGATNKPLKVAKLHKTISALRGGIIRHIDNKGINRIASILGCPIDIGAGIYLEHHIGYRIHKGEKLMTLYSESHEKMREALVAYHQSSPIIIK